MSDGYVRPGPPTGVKQEVPGDHFRGDLLEPASPGEHVWTAMAQYRVDAEALRVSKSGAGAPFHLDKENLIGIVIGCYVCEQPYSNRLSYRRCPGEPGTPVPEIR